MVPAKWPILVHVYEALFSVLGVTFPVDHYPMLVQAGFDHDIQLPAYNLTITDFQRAGYEFPFVDFLGDNYTAFRWVPHQIITGSNMAAVQGSQAYGTNVTPADAFDPPCDAYRKDGDRSIFRLSSSGSEPSFANGSVCDNQIRLFDSAFFFGVEDAALLPRPVEGSIHSSNFEPLTGTQKFETVFGWQVSTPFVENNYLDCSSFQGYSGTDLPGY
ncbi:MAG: hypothetical protein STHCBS139747_006645 [Sporothrix thermara]